MKPQPSLNTAPQQDLKGGKGHIFQKRISPNRPDESPINPGNAEWDSIPQHKIEVGAYDIAKWIKATFNGQTKRIYNPPQDLNELCSVLKSRFPVLKLLMENKARPQVPVLSVRNIALSQKDQA